MLGDIN
jgi:hypothetical protein